VKKAMLVLSCFGILISLYLTYFKFTSDPLLCGIGNCHAVQHSKYGNFLGIPVAILGIVYYLGVVVSITNFSKRVINMVLIWGLLFSTYLTYIEVFVLKEICGWCVVSFVNIIVIYVIHNFGPCGSETKTENS